MTGPETPHYGTGPVPPGAYAPRPQRPGPPRQEDLAEYWQRLVAALVDGAIVGALALVVLAVIGAGFFSDGDLGAVDVVVGLLLTTVFFTLIALLYAPLMMARTNGQTLGKMATGCRVVRADGRRVGVLWAALREVLVKGLLLGIASSITGGIAFVVDGVWPLVDGQNRALHDIVVDSRVVRA
jgi:uncharacterized RDD family membrane protein YckC